MTAQDLFDQIIPRLASAPPLTLTFLDAINQTCALIANRLVNEWGSDLVRSESVLSFGAGVNTAQLPDGYIGMYSDPYIEGTTSGLTVAPAGTAKNYQVDPSKRWAVSSVYSEGDIVTANGKTYISLQDTNMGNVPPTSTDVDAFWTRKTGSTPSMYAILRDGMVVYPTPLTAVNVIVEHYSRPERLTDMSEDIPFYGAMDYVVMDALLRIGTGGGFATTMPDYKYINELVDDIARRRTPKTVKWKYTK